MLGFQSAVSAASSVVEGLGENTKGMLQLVPFLFDNKEQSSGSRTSDEMARPRLSLKGASANPTNFLLDTGSPLLNCTLDGVLKIGGVGAAHAATQEAYSWMRKGICTSGTEAQPKRSSSQINSSPIEHVPTTRRDIEKIVKKAGKEGLQWGLVAGIYAGFEYGMEKARGGKHDWKNAAVGGALTGVMLSVSDGRVSQDKMVRTALTASALATAAEFLRLF